MDYLIEARKFVWRAQDTKSPDEAKAHLKLADDMLGKAIEERDASGGGKVKGLATG
jgi:hypothetical protein